MSINYSVELNAGQVEVQLTILSERFSPNGIKTNLEQVGRFWLRRVDLGFSDGRDPYGNPWPPGKKLQGKTLIQTSLLRRSFATEVDGETLWLGVRGPASKYAGFHQTGYAGGKVITPTSGKALRFVLPDGTVVFTKKVVQGELPARPMVPTDEGGLPKAWEEDLFKVFGAGL